jgi:CO dehydrogenase maturation factor
MTAGADAFASGLFTRFDTTFLIVEPTQKSMTVYEQYKKYARDYEVDIKVIANKIEGSDDINFIKSKVGDDLVAVMGWSKFVKESDRGTILPFGALEPENHKALRDVVAYVDNRKRDWRKSYKQAVEFHIKNANSWANAAAGKDLVRQVDPSFDIESLVASIQPVFAG